MFKLAKHRYMGSVFVGIVLLMVVTGTAVAGWINLSHGHSCGPTQGNFIWAQSNSTNYVAWYQYAKWTGSQYSCMNSAWDWYHLESEAYNPGSGSSCDKLHTYFTSYTLPSRSTPIIDNGCGSATYKEETKFYIKSSGIGNAVEYWTYTQSYKYNAIAGNHEVNWSFSNLLNDWWAAKIGYQIALHSPYATYTPYCSSPSGILTGYSGC